MVKGIKIKYIIVLVGPPPCLSLTRFYIRLATGAASAQELRPNKNMLAPA